MSKLPSHQYGEVMSRIADRISLIRRIMEGGKGSFSSNEGIAFQLRKVIEGMAFACVVASENGTKSKIRSARGHWNARNILNDLAKRGLLTLPNPSRLRNARQEESNDGIKTVIEGIPEKCLTKLEVVEIYDRTHAWLHETNPFYSDPKDLIANSEDGLWSDADAIFGMLERHFIAVSGEAFYCTLFDTETGRTKVLPLTRPLANAQTH